MRTKLAIAVLVLLVGCTPAGPDWAAMNREADHVQNRCWARWKLGQLHNFSEAIQCGTPGVRAIYARYGFPYMDLVDAFQARMLAIAERYDRKEISEAEFYAQEAELRARYTTDVSLRNAAAAAGGSPAAPRIALPITCNTVGFQTICY